MTSEPIHAHAQSRDVYASQHVGQGASASRAEVNDHGSKTFAIVALIFGAGAIVGLAVLIALAPMIIDAKVQAGIAKAEETSRLASTNARLSLEKLDQATTRIAVLEDRLQRSR